MDKIIRLPYKEKKTAIKLITDVFKENGVQFNLISESEAITYLEDRNYYYKLACYRKNFRRNKNNQYIDLDFQYLILLSKIDKRFRYILLQMTLETEHFLKVAILKDVSYNNKVDGYAIVTDFISSYNDKHEKKISIPLLVERGKNRNSVHHGIYAKVTSNNYYMAVWQLIEILQMQELEYFFKYYVSRFQGSEINIPGLTSLIISTRYIRNASAHNSPLLINLADCPHDAFTARGGVNDYYISTLLKSHFDEAKLDIAVKPTYRFKDIAAVFKLYKMLRISPKHSIDPLITDLRSLFEDIKINPPCPKSNNDVITFFTNLNKLFLNIFE